MKKDIFQDNFSYFFKNQIDEFNLKINSYEYFSSIYKKIIISDFEGFICTIYGRLDCFYNGKDIYKIKKDIFHILSSKLFIYYDSSIDDRINPEKIISDEKDIMLHYSKNYFMEKLINGEFCINDFSFCSDPCFKELTNDEKKLFFFTYIYHISTGGKDVKANEKNNDFCKSLSFSKCKLFFVNTSLYFKKLNMKDNDKVIK